MRLLINFCIVSFSVLFLASCESDELETYSGPSSIYFSNAVGFSINSTPLDTLMYSFGRTPASISSVTLTYPVKITGSLADKDRFFAVKVDDSSTLKENIDFSILTDSLIIKAGKSTGTVKLTVKRTPEMKTQNQKIYISLVSNENFVTEISNKKVMRDKTVKKILTTKFVINDFLVAPPRWLASYLGPFGINKYTILVNQLEVDPDRLYSNTSSSYSVAECASMGVALSRYLKNQSDAGTPVYIEDGVTLMTSGAGL
ncbi:DUF4843 domain-containing protein [Solitalea sp. MAHUQ-68]|uniref:DUF4843 domain-containing protein n=1 Tax=Solitalea agri TaxID=2953739 RepID=A0A9X2F1M1_9SPHI|nr:DUF4843 domain-containing protein [Solitalea agri]MCO4292444.1 DUF4843 domain-containing protein [Solitalea agri]